MTDEVSVGVRKEHGRMVVLQRAYLLGVFRQWPEGAEGTLTLTRKREPALVSQTTGSAIAHRSR